MISVTSMAAVTSRENRQWTVTLKFDSKANFCPGPSLLSSKVCILSLYLYLIIPQVNARGSSSQFLPLDHVYQAFIETSASRDRKHGYTVPANLNYNGKTYTDKHDIVNQFNEYFINIGPNLASTIHSSIKPDAFLPATPSSSVFLSPVDSAQVELALSGLDRHKATIDIPNYLIKIASNLLSTPLTNLFNESIESGIVPDIFKIKGYPSL